MISRHVLRPSASEDLDAQLDYYEHEAGLDRYPEAGALKRVENSRLKGLRSWPVSGFEDIRIYYLRADEDTLRIVRILHGKRDLDRILEREEG